MNLPMEFLLRHATLWLFLWAGYVGMGISPWTATAMAAVSGSGWMFADYILNEVIAEERHGNG